MMNVTLPNACWNGPGSARRELAIDWCQDTEFGIEIKVRNARPPGLWRAKRSNYVELDLRRAGGRVPNFPMRSHARWPWLDAMSR